MWFRNLQIYRLPQNELLALEAFEAQLAAHVLKACNATEAKSAGWVPPRADGPLIHAVNGQWLLTLGVEQKLLPSSIVKQTANERAHSLSETQGRKIGRRELRELRESVFLELLPRAFINRRRTYGWIDPLNGWLAIDAASSAKAEEFLEHLHKSVPGFPAKLIETRQSPLAVMTTWVGEGEAPPGFTLDQDMELRSAENSKVRYVKHSLEGEEIPRHIAHGKVVSRLALTWNERIAFVLDEQLHIKRLEFLDILREQSEGQAENEDERFDLDFVLMTGEVARMLEDLLEALSGEAEKRT